MKIISFNANGIRSAAKKGFYTWLEGQNADFVCIQETKATLEQLKSDPQFFPDGYYCDYVDAEKKGYSGVLLYAREKPVSVVKKLGFNTADTEGRYIRFDYPNLSIASIYFPSGTSGEIRQAVKMDFLQEMTVHLLQLKDTGKPFILCGDYNIAHQKIDLKNWRGNLKNSGFLPEERAWLDHVLGPLGLVDAFRTHHPTLEQYTWWSNRGQARANNVGWRIDYQLVTPDLAKTIQDAFIYREQFFSDHAPLIIHYQGDPGV